MSNFRARTGALCLLLLSGCGGTPPPIAPVGTPPPIVPVGTSADTLKQQNKALFLMGGRITNRNGDERCVTSAVEFVSATSAAGGKQKATLTSRPIPGTTTRLFSLEIAPGTYSFDRFGCDREPGKAATRYQAANGKPFATFTVEAGDVVDLGVLSFVSSEVDGHPDAPFGSLSSRRYLLTFVDDTPEELRKMVPESLAAQLKIRHMTASEIVGRQEIASRCSEQRQERSKAPAAAGAAADPPLCLRVAGGGR